MSFVITGNEIYLMRVSISIDCHAEYANLLMEQCSNLFENRLRFIFEQIASDARQKYLLPKVIAQLVVDLGEIPLAEFDVQFCQRIANQLALELEKYRAVSTEQLSDQFKVDVAVSTTLPPSSTGEKIDNAAAFRRYLQHGYWPWPEAWLSEGGVDAWLMAQRKDEPDLWETLIARAGLSPQARRRLWPLLAPDTWRYWLDIAGPLTQHTLLLGALRYFQRNPQQGLSLPAVEAEVLVMPVMGNEELLTCLFSTKCTPPLIPWLKALWRHPPLRAWLENHLPAEHVEKAQLAWAESGLPDSAVASIAARKRASIETQEAAPDLTTISVSNAGLILLWPLLPDLFSRLGLWEKDQFIDAQAQFNAASWLDATVWVDDCAREWRMPLTKWLCGLPLDAEVAWQTPDEAANEQLQQWLAMLAKQLSAWRTLGMQDIRTLFLQRPGQLEFGDGAVTLTVQPEPFDILLRDWPWPLDTLMLPWLEQPLSIQWSSLPAQGMY